MLLALRVCEIFLSVKLFVDASVAEICCVCVAFDRALLARQALQAHQLSAAVVALIASL